MTDVHRIRHYHRDIAELSRFVACGPRTGDMAQIRWVPLVWGPSESRVKVSEIVATCAAFAGVSVSVLLSRRRALRFTRPRQAAMYLAATYTDQSLPAIGARCGGRDHTTVMHARRRVQDDLVAGGELFGEVVAYAEKELELGDAPVNSVINRGWTI